MSTRCMIAFQDDDFPSTVPPAVHLYQHDHGHPQSIVKDLADFFVKWNGSRPHPASYFEAVAVAVAAHFINFTLDRCFRQMIQSSTRRLKRAKAEGDKWSIEMAEEMAVSFRGEARYSGFRIVPHNDFHDDIEWYYVVTPTRVHVYHTQHNKHAEYNDFVARTNKNNWIVVSSQQEEFDIRAGKYPKRYDETTEQALWYQEAQKHAEEQAAQSGPLLPGLHEALSPTAP